MFEGQTTTIQPQDDRRAELYADQLVKQEFPGVKPYKGDDFQHPSTP
jgi:hypothetical protein